MFIISFGSYGGFYATRNKNTGSIRLCLGWLAFTLYFYDVEKRLEKILGNEKNLDKVTRFEVIDETGRAYTKYSSKCELSYQDDGRTLKVFISPRKE